MDSVNSGQDLDIYDLEACLLLKILHSKKNCIGFIFAVDITKRVTLI